MRTVFYLIITSTLFLPLQFQAQTTVKSISSEAQATVQTEGDLSEGQIMNDLSWAWNSSNACFVQTQAIKFTGNHVLYQTELPARTTMTITLIPEDKNANLSLYAYSGGGGALVPNLPRCVSCEADFKWDYKRVGRTQDHTRSVELRAINNPYPVTIGVTGANGLAAGAYKLEIKLEPWKY